MQAKRVYLDVYVLCRPFDDQQQARIRLETNALDLILGHIDPEERQMIVSPAHQVEILAIPALEERQHLLILLNHTATQLAFDLSAVRLRTETLAKAGMGLADAAHVAFAEFAQADFVTVDERLLRQCQRLNVQVWSGTPLAYCDKEELR
jgi:predicted nucleic acid-binding protein